MPGEKTGTGDHSQQIRVYNGDLALVVSFAPSLRRIQHAKAIRGMDTRATYHPESRIKREAESELYIYNMPTYASVPPDRSTTNDAPRSRTARQGARPRAAGNVQAKKVSPIKYSTLTKEHEDLKKATNEAIADKDAKITKLEERIAKKDKAISKLKNKVAHQKEALATLAVQLAVWRH